MDEYTQWVLRIRFGTECVNIENQLHSHRMIEDATATTAAAVDISIMFASHFHFVSFTVCVFFLCIHITSSDLSLCVTLLFRVFFFLFICLFFRLSFFSKHIHIIATIQTYEYIHITALPLTYISLMGEKNAQCVSILQSNYVN